MARGSRVTGERKTPRSPRGGGSQDPPIARSKKQIGRSYRDFIEISKKQKSESGAETGVKEGSVLDDAENLIARIMRLPSSRQDRVMPILELLVAAAEAVDQSDLIDMVTALDRFGPSRPSSGSELPPPVRDLTEKEIGQVKLLAQSKPWPGKRGTAVKWVKDTYSDYIPGLLREHLMPDPDLYRAFSRVARQGLLPDDVDVPTADENALRKLSKPERAKLLAARELKARSMRNWRKGVGSPHP